MSNRVKGITVEIGGDATGLDKALKGIEDEIRNTESTLKDVNKLLKLDPKNTELLAQKQKLLQQEISQTESKLKSLKDADKQAKAQLESGDLGQEQYDALQREIIETENRLKSLKDTTGSASSTLASVSKTTGDFGNKAKNLGQSLLPATAAITGVGAASVSMANNFEDAMSQAAGALGKPMSEMENLRQLAIQTGQDTVFSATDAGNAITELAKGGLTEADIQAGALQATMDLAASSGMDLGNAANVVVQAMGAFGLSANESAEAANALAGAAAASSTDVEPLTQGLAQCSAQAKNAGWDIQETTAVLGRFADAGIVGSDAGTSLKTMLQRLAAPTDTAAAEIEKLGIQTRDSQGNLLGASDMAEELQNKLGGLSPAARDAALQTIFGSDAMRAATVMMNSGEEGLQKYIAATNDQESAQRLANSQMGDTSKAIEEMKGSLETAAITIGDKIAPVIQKVAEFITDLTNKFSALPDSVQTIIVVIAAIVAALGPALMIIGQMSLGVSALTKAFSKMSTITKIIGPIKSGIKALFGVISAHPVIAVITAIIAAVVILYNKCEWFRDGVNAIVSAVIGFFQGLPGKAKEIFSSLVSTLQSAWTTIKSAVGDAITTIKTTVSSAWTAITTAIGNAMTTIQTTIQTVWNAILSNPIVQTIVTTVQSLFQNMVTTLQGIWSGLVSIASGAWELLKNTILGPVLLLIDLVTGDFEQLKSDAQNIWNNMKEAASKIWEGIKQVVSSLAEGLINGVKTGMTGLKNALSTIWNTIKTTASNVWTSIKATASNIWNNIKVSVTNIVNGLKQALSNAWANIKSAASSAWTNIKNFVVQTAQNLKQSAVNAFNNMVSGIGNALSGVYSAVVNGFRSAISYITSLPSKAIRWGRDFIDGLKSGIMSGVRGIVNAVKGIGDKIRSFLHFSRPDEGPLHDYETWMPDFMEGLAKGIERNRGLVQSAVEKVSGDLKMNVNPILENGRSTGYGTTEVNFYGNYKFESQSDIDYFMNQAALRVARTR